MKPLYAIRQISTGFFLPNPKGRNSSGGSFTEPTDPDVEPPRLFKNKKAAATCLTQWAKGEHHAQWDYADIDGFGGGGERYVDSITIKPVAKRNIHDMEVVEVELVVFNN